MKIIKAILIIIVLSLFSFTLVGADVLNGKALFNDPKFAGSTNDKSCNSCHPDGSRLENAADKATFSILGNQLDSLEDTVNTCIKMALKGNALSKDSQQMKDIVQYIKSLKGKKIKKKRIIKGC
jgi:cytochrome c